MKDTFDTVYHLANCTSQVAPRTYPRCYGGGGHLTCWGREGSLDLLLGGGSVAESGDLVSNRDYVQECDHVV